MWEELEVFSYLKLKWMSLCMVVQVCPQLKLPLIRRILCNFVPDEFAPEPISPSLIAAINTEVPVDAKLPHAMNLTPIRRKNLFMMLCSYLIGVLK